MEGEDESSSPDFRARDHLVQYIDLIRGDSGELVSQLKQDITCELDIDWEDIKKKVISRKYTTYASLDGDIQKILEHVLAASKRNNKQRGSGTTHKSIKRHLDKYERYLRAGLYEWHPKGKDQATKVCYRLSLFDLFIFHGAITATSSQANIVLVVYVLFMTDICCL